MDNELSLVDTPSVDVMLSPSHEADAEGEVVVAERDEESLPLSINVEVGGAH